MKLCKLLFFLIGVACSSLYSQANDSLLNYYPLQIGNIWEYKIDVKLPHRSINQYEKFSIEVIGDSIFSNGKKYSILKKKYTPEILPDELYFERIDSLTYNIYRYNLYFSSLSTEEFIIDSLKAGIGDGLYQNYLCRITNSPVSCRYYEFLKDSILGYWTEIKKVISGGFFEFDNHYWLANGIGLAQITAVDLNGRDSLYTWHLTYAKIGTKEYGFRTNIENSKNRILPSFILYQNYPNPFNLKTAIKYEIYETTSVELNIYNELGQRMISEFLGNQKPGIHNEVLNFENMSSGLYFIELRTKRNVQMIKCLLVK